MKERARPLAKDADPWPYDGPIQTAYGDRPFNRYLWPTEQWVAYDTIKHAPYEFRIDLFELADGRWATGGAIYEIEPDRVLTGERCCFPMRTAAIRAQAARVIRRARRAGRPDIVAWTLRTVVKTTVTKPRLAAAEAYAERLNIRANNVERGSEQLELFGADA